MRTFFIASAMCLTSSMLSAEEAEITPAAQRDGFLVHDVESLYQAGKTQIRVLVPRAFEPDKRYPVVYILPVEAGNEHRYGDGLVEVRQHDLHNRHRAIFVTPTFSHLPWYADHPADRTIRQEEYFLKVVVPFVEKTYAAETKPEGRLLLGFSKSGWGAWSLLLRHPDVFGRASAWDSPLMMDRLGKYGTAPIFGTQENFEKYRITELLRARKEQLGGRNRLVLTGYGSFRGEHEGAHRLLDELKIPHTYRDGPHRKHDWHSGWLPEAVQLLVE